MSPKKKENSNAGLSQTVDFTKFTFQTSAQNQLDYKNTKNKNNGPYWSSMKRLQSIIGIKSDSSKVHEAT